jgi:tetratricopeptide (TPR) repeat protein
VNSRWTDAEPEEDDFVRAVAVPSACPRWELTLAARAGALREETERRIAEHVGKCVVCKDLLRSLELTELADIRPEEEARIRRRVIAVAPIPVKPRLRWLWLSGPILVAAAAALLILRVQSPRPADVPATAVVKQDSAPPVKPMVLALNKPAVLLPPDALIFRGADDGSQGYGKELVAALAPFRADDYATAAALLDSVAVRYPKRPEAPLYQGVSLLFLNRPADAIAPLERASGLAKGQLKGDNQLKSDAQWYLAAAYERVGDRDRAIAQLRNLCGAAGSHSADSCSGLTALGSPR